MALDQYAQQFFQVLREYKDDTSGESLYDDAGRKESHDVAIPFFEDLPDDFVTLLDVGCGAGFDSAYFANKGKRVTAITANPTPAQIRFADINSFTILEMDMNDLKFPDFSFDAVLCKHSLEHSISPLASLRELRRVLKPKGYLFIVLPPHHETLVESGHFTQGWSLEQMIYCLCVAGFDVKNGAFRSRPGNLEGCIQPHHSVPNGRGLYELKDRMPIEIQRIMNDDLHGAYPSKFFNQISWPFSSRARETIEKSIDDTMSQVCLRTLLKVRLRQKGFVGKILATFLG